MTSKLNVIVTARDLQVMQMLARTPLDARQLLRVSETFDEPFSSDRVLRRRLKMLADVGTIRIFQYATKTPGLLNYYKLTPLGFQMLNGQHCKLPSKAFFRETSLTLQEHSRCLGDLIVALLVSANQCDATLTGFHRENELELTVDNKKQRPDCAIQLTAGGRLYSFLVELDRGTEPIRSKRRRDSLAGKIRFYDRYRDRSMAPFRVLTVFTHCSARMTTYTNTAKEEVKNRARKLFLAAMLDDLLERGDPLNDRLFLDHDRNHVALLENGSKRRECVKSAPVSLVYATAF